MMSRIQPGATLAFVAFVEVLEVSSAYVKIRVIRGNLEGRIMIVAPEELAEVVGSTGPLRSTVPVSLKSAEELASTKPRGFAAMAPDMRRDIAARGGKKAHERGTAHTWTSETCQGAAKKSVAVRKAKRQAGSPSSSPSGSSPKPSGSAD